jgi:hypothetical protein
MSPRLAAGRPGPSRLPHALIGLAAAAALLAAPAPASAAGLDEAGYWRLADANQTRLDSLWSEHARMYRPGGAGTDPAFNASLLLTHAVAAQRGHEGPARNDHRGRLLAARLTQSAPFVDGRALASRGSQRHSPGWVSSMDTTSAEQHLVFDAEVVDGLVAAWRARRALALPAATVAAIEDQVGRTVAGRFWRWPAIRLNQINWYGLMYAASATVNGRDALLRHDLARQVHRFVAGIRGRGGAAGNLGPGARFHYLPHRSAQGRMNVDSAEYANIVVSVTRFLDQGRAAGMRVRAGDLARLRVWARRVIAGYWTHAGYLNWDTGLGFERWHQSKKVGLSAQALIGLAASDSLGLEPRWRAWAKDMLDNGLRFYERQSQRAGGPAPALFFGVHKVPQTPASARLGAARVGSNAARAIAAGLGRARSSTPPPLYAYDPDTGRLAVTTRSYNTAVVPVSQGAFPYGGLELARLYDGGQDVAGNVGGLPPASFGLVVADAGGRRVLATQHPRRTLPGAPPLRLTRAPSGVGASASRAGAGRAYAGPFRSLEATGTTAAGALSARVTHRFSDRSVSTSWSLRSRGRRALAARVLFPSYGRGARVEALLRDGRHVTVGSRPLALARVRAFLVRSQRSGYRVVPARAPAGAVATSMAVRSQWAAPRAGRSLVVRIARGRTGGARFAARLTVDPALGVR